MSISKKTRFILALLKILPFSLIVAACRPSPEQAYPSGKSRIGVLLVNHGSRSPGWRKELLRLEENVRTTILSGGKVAALGTAFMEYTEPSIATQLRDFDRRGITDVVLVPIFLTVSTHSFDDIPTIVGLKDDPHAREALRKEKIERYTPSARVHITPLLDFPAILQENILRRVKSMSQNPAEEGLALIAYGDQTYEKEWITLMKNVAGYVKSHTGIGEYSYGWCGHLVHYDPKKTTAAVAQVLARKKRALVLPVLVAHDEMFQVKIIGGGVSKIKDNARRVAYRADSILPDAGLEQWVADIAIEHVERILSGKHIRKQDAAAVGQKESNLP